MIAPITLAAIIAAVSESFFPVTAAKEDDFIVQSIAVFQWYHVLSAIGIIQLNNLKMITSMDKIIEYRNPYKVSLSFLTGT